MRIGWQIFYCISILISIAIAFLLGALFFCMHHQCIDFSALEHHHASKASIVLDDEGNEWMRFQLDRREPISYDKIPQILINAFVAAEDWQFFAHHGLSWKGILRSLLVNLYRGRKAQGASTITQQLVRLLFFDTKKTFTRKIKEQLYAILIEQQYTKEQIMEAYLNNAYFGSGIYGVEAACQRFWDKHASELTVDEAATLAGIVQLPEGHCPLTHPAVAQKRRDHILGNMRKLGFISQEQYTQAKNQLVCVKPPREKTIKAFHLREALRLFLESKFSKEQLYAGGLVIQTTISRATQNTAEEAFKTHCQKLRTELGKKVDGAVMSINSHTGAIQALVGGFDFGVSKYNRAFMARRQMGSVFKIILYAAAMNVGCSFADTEIDEPIEIMQNNQVWAPHNWDNTFSGQMTLAFALARSNNIVAVKTCLRVGPDNVAALAKRFHFECPIGAYPSLALGCIDVSVKEVTAAFNVFANNGVYIEPYYVSWVKDQWGSTIWRHTPYIERLLSTQTCGKVAKVLGIGMERVKKTSGQQTTLTTEAICKTGTTNDSRTCWFAGATPSRTTVVYTGCDANISMGEIYPIRASYPVWRAIHEGLPDKQAAFTYDSSLVPVTIHELTGQPLDDSNAEGAITIFR